MNDINKLLKNRKAITVISTLVLFFLAVNFLFVGLFEFDLIYKVLALSSYTLYRLWAITISLCIGIVAYALYLQNQVLVNESLKKVKEKVVAETKELAEKVDKIDDGIDDAEVKEVEAKPIEETKAESSKVTKAKKETKK